MRKTILTYGLISGAIAAVLLVSMTIYMKSTQKFDNGAIIGYTGILLSMIFVFLGVRAYRDNVAGGTITFAKAFLVGILITAISCICYVITWFFVYATIFPDFMEIYAAQALERLQQSGASAEKISQEAQKMEEFKTMYKNPLIRFGLTFLEPFPLGFLVTLISAIVLRRKAA